MNMTFAVGVSYGQICVFPTHLESPFNAWTDAHYSQCFTWRPVSVSFATLEGSGSCETTVQIKREVDLRPNTVRAIQVPFSVAGDGIISVGSIEDETELHIPEGEYCLVYETGFKSCPPAEGEELDEDTAERQIMWAIFTLLPGQSCRAQILRMDEQLSPTTPLYMEAWPA